MNVHMLLNAVNAEVDRLNATDLSYSPMTPATVMPNDFGGGVVVLTPYNDGMMFWDAVMWSLYGGTIKVARLAMSPAIAEFTDIAAAVAWGFSDDDVPVAIAA